MAQLTYPNEAAAIAEIEREVGEIDAPLGRRLTAAGLGWLSRHEDARLQPHLELPAPGGDAMLAAAVVAVWQLRAGVETRHTLFVDDTVGVVGAQSGARVLVTAARSPATSPC